jgi:short-subunit dehydrogenase
MPNRVIVITGATDGLGRALSGALAHEPATTLILHGRDQGRLADLANTLADVPASITPSEPTSPNSRKCIT